MQEKKLKLRIEMASAVRTSSHTTTGRGSGGKGGKKIKNQSRCKRGQGLTGKQKRIEPKDDLTKPRKHSAKKGSLTVRGVTEYQKCAIGQRVRA